MSPAVAAGLPAKEGAPALQDIETLSMFGSRHRRRLDRKILANIEDRRTDEDFAN
jgi:hypothetical protein